MIKNFFKFLKYVILIFFLLFSLYHGYNFSYRKYLEYLLKSEISRRQALLDGVSIKMNYDKNHKGVEPIVLNINNNTSKKIYKIKYVVGSFKKGFSNNFSDIGKGYEYRYSYKILAPKESYEGRTFAPKTIFDCALDGLKKTGVNLSKDQELSMKEENLDLEFRVLYREITFSDGEKISGYSDIDDILLFDQDSK